MKEFILKIHANVIKH